MNAQKCIIIAPLFILGAVWWLWKPAETQAQREKRAAIAAFIETRPYLSIKPRELVPGTLPPPKHEVLIHPASRPPEKTTSFLPAPPLGTAKPESQLIELNEHHHGGEIDETEFLAAVRLDTSKLHSVPAGSLDRYLELLGSKGATLILSESCACFESETCSLVLVFTPPGSFRIWGWLKARPLMLYTGEFTTSVPHGDPTAPFGEIASAIVQALLHPQ